ncbi:MAG: hypothetical protein AAF721_22640 [Myxococcota bacterium]
MRARLLATLAAGLLVGCPQDKPGGEVPKAAPKDAKKGGSESDPAAPTKPVETKAEPATAEPAGASSGGSGAPADAEPAPTRPTLAPLDPAAKPSPWPAADSTDVRIDGRIVIRIGGTGEGTGTLLWAQRVTEDGLPGGTAKKLRVTSGEVGALEAAVSRGTLWVAWTADLGAGKKWINAVAAFDLAFDKVREPRILRTYDDPDGERGGLMVAPRDDGGAVVAALVGTKTCKSVQPEEPGLCRGMQVDLIDSAGASLRRETRWLEGGSTEVNDVLATPTGALVAYHAYVGGPMTDVAFVPNDKASKVESLPSCGYPEIDLALVGDSVVSLCPDPDGSGRGPDAECFATGADDSCGQMMRTALPGAPPLPPADRVDTKLRQLTARCDNGVPLYRLQWGVGAAAQHLDVPAAMLSLGWIESCP